MYRFWSFRSLRRGKVNQSLKAHASASGLHRLVIQARPGSDEETTTEFTEDPSLALQVARRSGRPVELWRENDHLCTIDTMAGAGSMWVIVPGSAHAKPRKSCEVAAGKLAVTPPFEAVFCIIEGLEERDVGDCIALSAETAEAAEDQVARLRLPPGANCVEVRRDGEVMLRWVYPAINIDPRRPDAEHASYRSASEQMFYLAMPLAHVVTREEYRRETRRRREIDRLCRPVRSMQMR